MSACPECDTQLDATAAALYLCLNWREAKRIVRFLRRSVIVKVGNDIPRRLHVDGRREDRGDITQRDKNVWFSANGLRLEAVRLTWRTVR